MSLYLEKSVTTINATNDHPVTRCTEGKLSELQTAADFTCYRLDIQSVVINFGWKRSNDHQH